jgi:hypothetical protein
MIGFKQVPAKGIFLTFIASVIMILLLYVDFVTDESLPEEKIQSSDSFRKTLIEIESYKIHEVMNGENLSIIFEDFEVPLNTAYRIFRLDEENLLSQIRPGDRMRFTYLGKKIKNIEISKDNVSSLVIDINNEIKIKKIKKDVELIKSYKSGVINTSFYEAALKADIPDSIIMDFAYIFGWDIDFVFDIRGGDSIYVV